MLAFEKPIPDRVVISITQEQSRLWEDNLSDTPARWRLGEEPAPIDARWSDGTMLHIRWDGWLRDKRVWTTRRGTHNWHQLGSQIRSPEKTVIGIWDIWDGDTPFQLEIIQEQP